MSKGKEIIMWALINMIVLVVGIWIVNNAPKTTLKQQIKKEIICEHEYVITSKYVWFLDKYKTISKCIKCGNEV